MSGRTSKGVLKALEPLSHNGDIALPEDLTRSIAISLKRIADALAGNGVEVLLDKIANHPMNAYGEGFSSALQEALVRGQKGISIYDR